MCVFVPQQSARKKVCRSVAVEVGLILSLRSVSALLRSFVWVVGADWPSEKAKLLFLCGTEAPSQQLGMGFLCLLCVRLHFVSVHSARSSGDAVCLPPSSDACGVASHLSTAPLEPGSLLGEVNYHILVREAKGAGGWHFVCPS